MRAIKLTKTEQGLETLAEWYDRFYKELRFPKRTRRVDTSFGYTDVVITGPEDCHPGHPVVLLHGAAAGAPFVLHEIADLPERMRIFALNIPGQSTRATPRRLSFKNGEYADWLLEVFEALDLDAPTIAGVSWGGSVALQLARHAPTRVGGLVLVVPGSIVSGPILKGFVKLGWPMMRYSLRSTEVNRDRALAHLFTTPDPMWTPYLGDVLKLFNTDFRVPPLMKPEHLSELQAKVFVIAADLDLSFPGESLLARAAALFPNLVGTHLLRNSRHVPSFKAEDRQAFAQLFEQAVELVQSSSMTQ